MCYAAQPSPLVISMHSPVHQQLQSLAQTPRVVCFAGLPGTGKSLLIHQLAHMASAMGKTVHLLQWDVARPVFEASPAGQQYPSVDGVTHGVIRRAVGLWARRALAQWQQQYPMASDLLIGETPFIGHRLIELARRDSDEVEALLSSPASLFVVPVPSPAVRDHIEAMRRHRSTAPLHAREQEDAPPQVLQALWQELYRTASRLGVQAPASAHDTSLAYHPMLYQHVYQTLLIHRHCRVISIDSVFPTSRFSPYHFAVEKRDLVPSMAEVTALIQEAAQHYSDQQVLQREMEQWYRV